MKASEKRLLIFFLLLLFVVANVFVASRLIRKKRSIEAARLELDLNRAGIEELIKGKEDWLKREVWIAENQPVFSSQVDAEKELLAAADAAAEFQVTVTRRDLEELEETGGSVQTGMWMKAKGSLENVMRWLYRLQQPEEFRVIRSLKILPDRQDPSQIECEFLMLRWYQKGESA